VFNWRRVKEKNTTGKGKKRNLYKELEEYPSCKKSRIRDI